MVLLENLSTNVYDNVKKRPTLETIYQKSAMNRSRFMKLYSMLYGHGPGNGTFLTLPFDQLVEHGPGHQFKHATSAEAKSVIELANKGNFSALVLSIGQAEKYQHDIGDIPLIVKIDGHLYLGNGMDKYHPRPVSMTSIERAAKVADGIGMAWYPGEIETGQDMERISNLIEESHNANLPVVLWGYTRGPNFERIQSDNLLCCHSSVSYAESLGADIVKVKFPSFVKKEKQEEYKRHLESLRGKMPECPDAYLELEPKEEMSEQDIKNLHIKRSALVASSAGRTLIGYSGGAKSENPLKDLLKSSEYSLNGGIEGRIAGRNLWGSEIDKALELNNGLVKLMVQTKYGRVLKEERFP